MEKRTLIKVGMADLKAASYPDILTTLGLGSCVGIALYDSCTKIIGLAHVMLPSSQQARNNSNTAKFADTAIARLLEEMKNMGAKPGNIIAKLAGGAQMFNFSEASDILRIGTRNVIAAKERLKEFNIPIVAEDTGGNFGRTIELHSDSGILVVKTIGHGSKEI